MIRQGCIRKKSTPNSCFHQQNDQTIRDTEDLTWVEHEYSLLKTKWEWKGAFSAFKQPGDQKSSAQVCGLSVEKIAEE